MANGDFAENETEVVSMYRSMNIGNFQYIYTSVLNNSACVMFNQITTEKKICYLITALLLFTIYKTEYTTALLLSVISTLFLIFTYIKKRPSCKEMASSNIDYYAVIFASHRRNHEFYCL